MGRGGGGGGGGGVLLMHVMNLTMAINVTWYPIRNLTFYYVAP